MLVSARQSPPKGNQRFFGLGLFCFVFILAAVSAFAQATTFGGSAQHTSVYAAPAQTLNRIKWTTSIDLNNSGVLAHYGSPLVTAANTVLVPVKIAGDSFRVDAFNGATGAPKYITPSDYIMPAHGWIPAYNPCVATGPLGTRMYFAGAGGTLWHIDNPDSDTPGPPIREVFYTSLANYNANAAAYNSTIFVNTPLTADEAGNIYFGFRVQGTAPAPLNTSQSGYARISANGTGTFVLAGTAANDPDISFVTHNLAPALSNDGNTLYVVVRASANSAYGYLLGLNPTTLQTKYSVFLRDPRNPNNGAIINDNGTASPMVAPDGDVYFGVLVSNNGSRGFLLRFSGDLSVTKTPGGFGWDYTPGIVPASAVPSYTGSSSYLLFSKYNDYPSADASGVNRVALLDPNATQIDPHTSANGLVEMREVLTVIGPTPDPVADPGRFPLAVREWCINAPAVNPATNSVFFTSEDGRSYRWNLITNTLDQSLILNPGFGQPYVPTVIGPDGTVYTLNGGTFFAMGNNPGVNVTITSSSPDLRNTVAGSPITFTATVTGSPTAPTGTVTFATLTFSRSSAVGSTLGINVPLDANGRASVTTSSLTVAEGFLGNHFVRANYNGDATHPAASVTMVQKVHSDSSSTALAWSVDPSSQALSFTATVSAVPFGAGTPTGMVTFQDGATVIGQVPLSPIITINPTFSAVASITKSNLGPGSHNITATYASDTQFAASAAAVTLDIQSGMITGISSSLNPSSLGQLVVFTTTVVATGSGATETPTGAVTFKEGGTILATRPLDAAGRAFLATSALSSGSHAITSDFTGTNGWANSSATLTQVVRPVQSEGPVLLTENAGAQAIALDLVTQTRDPFSLVNPDNLSIDLRRRVDLFVWRLGLLPDDNAADVTVIAEDDEGRSYNLVVEFVGPLAGVGEVNQIVVRLPDSVVGAPRDLWVKVGVHGRFSNSAIIKIGAP